jgi:OPA family glycerol-3-phosphate transporter-like MFS transporter 1/2
MSNWFGKKKRGLIFGLWNSHTSIGNILGSLIAAEYVETDWSLSFIIPGLIIGVVGFVLFLFLVVNPSDVGCTTAEPEERHENGRQYRKLENRVANVDNSSGISSETDDTDIILGEEVSSFRPKTATNRHSFPQNPFRPCCAIFSTHRVMIL